MTVSSTINREQYATDGVTTAFTIHFPFFDDTDVNAVFVDEDGVSTTLALNTDFTVTGGDGDGGTLDTTGSLSPLDNNGTLTIYREIPYTQETEYVEDDPLPADSLNDDIDRAAMRDQQIKDAQDRALTFPVTIDPDVSAELPLPEAGKFLGWNVTEDALENVTVVTADSVVFATVPTLDAGVATGEAIDPATFAGSKFNPTGKHLIPILAASMQPATTNGAAVGAVETTTNKVLYRTLDFDQTTQEFAGFVLPMPSSWNEGTITFRAVWTAASSSGGVAWALQAVAFSDDDALDTAYGTEQVVTDTLIATGDVHRTSESSAITVGGSPAASDLVAFRVKRVPANGSDTLAADARLLGVEVFITTNAGTDA
jgi:hypothetical protein